MAKSSRAKEQGQENVGSAVKRELRKPKTWVIIRSGAGILKPPPARTADEWAEQNRILPPGRAEPGPFNPHRTPYMIPFQRACCDPRYSFADLVCATQMGKTDSVLNIAGQKLDDDPVPVLYVGPTQSNVIRIIEPRVLALFRSAKSLWHKLAKGKKLSKPQKEISGVTFRLAWAGSASEIASADAGLVIVDELDRMEDNSEGDVYTQCDSRRATYSDGKCIASSSPTIGTVNEETNTKTGLTHWALADPEDVQSPIWRNWQNGTRCEWAWPCLHCKKYFVARFSCLTWPDKCTSQQALRQAKLKCPNCGALIDEGEKSEMNARGVAVGPLQAIDKDGNVSGPEIESDRYTLWVSGLCSPWVTFGQRAKSFIDAVATGMPTKVQAVINQRFGELYKLKGEAPEWQDIMNTKEPYQQGSVPKPVEVITCAVDVQKNRFVYSVRGWKSHSMESWLIGQGEIYGETEHDAVWDDLADLLRSQYDKKPISLMLIDSGYRPGDKYRRPDNQIYKFCRRFRGWARPTKGHDTQDKPIQASRIDITIGGKLLKSGLTLWHIDTDYFKSYVHARLEWPEGSKGGWHFPEDTPDAYFMQLTAEAKLVKPSGRILWVRVRKDNHYLDCEVLNTAAAHMLNLHMAKSRDSGNNMPQTAERVAAQVEAATGTPAKSSTNSTSPRVVGPGQNRQGNRRPARAPSKYMNRRG